MSSHWKVAGLVCVMVLGSISIGCSRGPSRIVPPAMSPQSAGSGALAKYDTDKNGTIDPAELENAPPLKASMKQLDTNGDGKVSADEVSARVQKWIDSKLGLTSLSVVVNMDSHPLSDATVTLIPEEYLGSETQKAVGKTDASGATALTIEKPQEPGLGGVQPGYYRVEISKMSGGTETVPAKYNSQTTLGQEVALDAESMLQGSVIFNLTSK